MPVQGINHVTLKVRELERSRRFYELLGFHQSGHREGMLFFSAGGHHHHIALIEMGPQAPQAPRGAVGSHHIGVTVDTERELGRLHRAVADAGYKVVQVIDHLANRSFYVRDPDGHLIEMTWDVPPAHWADVAENPFLEDRPYHIPEEGG